MDYIEEKPLEIFKSISKMGRGDTQKKGNPSKETGHGKDQLRTVSGNGPAGYSILVK